MLIHPQNISSTEKHDYNTDTQHLNKKAHWREKCAAGDKTVGWYFQQGLVYRTG